MMDRSDKHTEYSEKNNGSWEVCAFLLGPAHLYISFFINQNDTFDNTHAVDRLSINQMAMNIESEVNDWIHSFSKLLCPN